MKYCFLHFFLSFIFCSGLYAQYSHLPRANQYNHTPWELHAYKLENNFPRYRISFPPFVSIKQSIFDTEESVDVLWNYKGKYYDNFGKLLNFEGSVMIPTFQSRRQLSSDVTLSKYIPALNVREINFSLDITNANFLFRTPKTMFAYNVLVDKNIVHSFARSASGNLVHESDLDVGTSKTMSLVFNFKTNDFNSFWYGHYNEKSVTVRSKPTMLNNYSQKREISYVRTDYYKQAIYKSTLAPFEVVESLFDKIIISGLKQTKTQPKYIYIDADKKSVRALKGDGVLYNRHYDSGLKNNYFIIFGAYEDKNDYPLLVVFNKSVELITINEQMELTLEFQSEGYNLALSVIPFAEENGGMPRSQTDSLFRGGSVYVNNRIVEMISLAFSRPNDFAGLGRALSGTNIYSFRRYSLFDVKSPPTWINRVYVPYNDDMKNVKINTLRYGGDVYTYIN